MLKIIFIFKTYDECIRVLNISKFGRVSLLVPFYAETWSAYHLNIFLFFVQRGISKYTNPDCDTDRYC